jgi:hypothetical protein
VRWGRRRELVWSGGGGPPAGRREFSRGSGLAVPPAVWRTLTWDSALDLAAETGPNSRSAATARAPPLLFVRNKLQPL